MGGAIKAEIRKIFTTRLWWGLLIALVFLSGGLSAAFASFVGADFGGSPSDNPFAQMTVGTAQIVYASGFTQYVTPLVPLALGVILITQEFRHQTITATLLATPRRTEVLLSKAAAVVVIGVVYGIAHVVLAGGFGGLVLALKGEPTYLGDAEVWKTFGLSVLVFVLWSLLGFGFGMLIRNQLAAVFTALGIALIAHIALMVIFSILNWDTPPKFLPDNLTLGMLVTSDPTPGTTSDNSMYFDWWTSALILVGYAAALSGVGAWLLSRRDVS